MAPHDSQSSASSALTAVRLDVWLDIACLFKTRSQATAACKGGKVEVNGQAGKPNRLLRPGDELRISRVGHKQVVVVQALADRHLPKAQARQLYEDRTPLPSPEELAIKRMLREAGIRKPSKAPDKRERRQLRRLKEER
ncbi:MAG TPA: RNA-binding S4 domain-containing protein [Thermoanaerobaculia bacterium]|nr:RNA-binding S4 domain-containing protein [Thermoanaerobaculia bacterium]